jgi:hypothetical protein
MSNSTPRKSSSVAPKDKDQTEKPARVQGVSGAYYYDTSRGHCRYCGELSCEAKCPQAMFGYCYYKPPR